MTREIRQLRSGERIPKGEPRRYLNRSNGYVRLRWKIGVGRYVEVYEHRVDGNHVVDTDHVHHRNHQRDDNRPENLAPLSQAEHGRHHRTISRTEVVRHYLAGLSTPQVAAAVGTDQGNVSRILRTEGIRPRRKADYAPHVAESDLRAARAELSSAPQIARHLGVPLRTVYRLMREYGIPAYPVGRPAANNIGGAP